MNSHSFQNAVKSRNEVKQDRKRSFGVKSVFDHKRFDALEISTMSCLSYNNNTTGRFSRNVTVFSFSFSLSHTHPHSLTCSLTLTHTYLRSFYLSSSFLPTCTLTLSRFLSLSHTPILSHAPAPTLLQFLFSLPFFLSLPLLVSSLSVKYLSGTLTSLPITHALTFTHILMLKHTHTHTHTHSLTHTSLYHGIRQTLLRCCTQKTGNVGCCSKRMQILRHGQCSINQKTISIPVFLEKLTFEMKILITRPSLERDNNDIDEKITRKLFFLLNKFKFE